MIREYDEAISGSEFFDASNGRFSAIARSFPSKLSPIEEPSPKTNKAPVTKTAAKHHAVPKRIARGRRPRSSAHLKVFRGMPPPPALPSAMRSRNCRPSPSSEARMDGCPFRPMTDPWES
eukprot:symbB.v1.2.028614.t1/scaffold3044.1/size64775/1